MRGAGSIEPAPRLASMEVGASRHETEYRAGRGSRASAHAEKARDGSDTGGIGRAKHQVAGALRGELEIVRLADSDPQRCRAVGRHSLRKVGAVLRDRTPANGRGAG